MGFGTISFDVSDLLSSAETLRKIEELIDPMNAAVIADAADIMEAALIAEAPGNMPAKISVDVHADHADFNFPPYAVFVQRGASPHVIEPVNARALHFFMKSGDEVFAAHVNHPGQAPNPFITRAVQRARPAIQARYSYRVFQAVRPQL